MTNTPGIVWLASYPKSGNTWLRALFSSYLAKELSVCINDLAVPIASGRAYLDDALGIETCDLTPTELRNLLPDAYNSWASDPAAFHYVKIHDAFDYGSQGQPLYPPAATRAVIHLLRDPRDVAVSFGHHIGRNLDETIDRLNNPRLWIGLSKSQKGQIPQYLSDWSGHARSWLESPLPRLSLRYEDLLANTCESFSKIVAFCGLEVDEARIARAVDACTFSRLQAQEQENDFRERNHNSNAPFFREGRAGGWREVLSPAQAARIVSAHVDMMRKFDYEIE